MWRKDIIRMTHSEQIQEVVQHTHDFRKDASFKQIWKIKEDTL